MSTRVASDHIMSTYKRAPVTFVRGAGATLWDEDGKEYIDLLAGIAVASVGHSHPKVVDAVSRQAAELIHVSNLFHTQPQEELAASLAEISGGYVSFFCNSGAESIEAALKLARKWAGAHKGERAHRVIAAHGGFHGRTFGALAATGQPAKQAPFAPMLEGFTHVPYGDAGALEDAMGNDVAAVLLEPIQGEAGVIVPPDGYLAAARELCDRFGALLIFDEVQTGLGRTGYWFGFQHDEVAPDVFTLAKALAGGLPMGACLARPQVAEAFSLGDHATTFGGGPVIAAAAKATLGVIEDEGLIDKARVTGAGLRAALVQVFPEAVEIRGRGLMLGVHLDRPAANEVVTKALEAGVVLNDPAPDVIRFTPPLVITDDQVDAALTKLQEVWDAVRAS